MPARVFPRDEDRELQRVREVQLVEVTRSGDRHQHVPALQRPLECRVRMSGRARRNSSLGAEAGSYNLLLYANRVYRRPTISTIG